MRNEIEDGYKITSLTSTLSVDMCLYSDLCNKAMKYRLKWYLKLFNRIIFEKFHVAFSYFQVNGSCLTENKRSQEEQMFTSITMKGNRSILHVFQWYFLFVAIYSNMWPHHTVMEITVLAVTSFCSCLIFLAFIWLFV